MITTSVHQFSSPGRSVSIKKFLSDIWICKHNKSITIAPGAFQGLGYNDMSAIALTFNNSSRPRRFLSIFNRHNLISIKSVAEQKFWILITKYVLEFVGVF